MGRDRRGDNGAFTPTRSTPSQTAWAILGLLAGRDVTSSSLRHGIDHLPETKRSGGAWNEELPTGTGSPKLLDLDYHFYRPYFPFLALTALPKIHS